MTAREYIALAKHTDVPDYDLIAERARHMIRTMGPVFHSMMGMVTEAGEFADQWKKALMYGKEIDLVNLDEELGDFLWYAAIYLEDRGKTFEEIMQQNIAKLKARYPNKFNSHDALNRDLDKERRILENIEEPEGY